MARAIVEPSARERLENAQQRITKLELLVAGIDDRLRSCDHSDVTGLMDSRRAAEDERSWLANKLAEYQSAADNEQWEEQRDALNAQWSPLAQRRIAATVSVRVCAEALLAALSETEGYPR